MMGAQVGWIRKDRGWIPTPSARALDDAVVRFQALRTCVDTLWIKSRGDETAQPLEQVFYFCKKARRLWAVFLTLT